MTTETQTIQYAAPSNYYPLNETSQQWQDWSVSKISLQTWYLVPVGIIGLVASVALRLVEGIFMLLANSCLAIKYLFVVPPNQTPVQNAAPIEPMAVHIPPPTPQRIADPLPVVAPLPNPPLLNPMRSEPSILPRLMTPAPSNPQLMALINPARPPSRQEQEVRGCTTRIQERANNQIIAIKQNPKTAITVATGLVAAGASIAFPPLLPFAAGAAAAKFAWDALTKKENND